MLNWIFLFLIVGSVLTGAFSGRMPQLSAGSLAAAKSSVDLAIGLIGQMALWLGFMGVLREAGILHAVARSLKGVMRRLFPEVPPEHPAMGAMIMNLAANIAGLGNAATPFGLKAMVELNKLNPRSGVATNAMALFLAINTSGVSVLPLGAVAVRAALGSQNAAGIIVPTLIATACSTATAICVAKLLERVPFFSVERAQVSPEEAPKQEAPPIATEELIEPQKSKGRGIWVWAIWLAIGAALVRHVMAASAEKNGFEIARGVLSDWLLPLLMLLIVLIGFSRKVKIYEVFVASAKEGFQIAVTIIPFLVAILVAIAMFRESGAMDVVIRLLSPLLSPLGFPPEALPMALIRPLSGSGALAVMSETLKTYGPDSFVGYLASTINGSQETTFYVLAVYFGSVRVKAIRHTLVACLAADTMGVVASLLACRLFFGAP